MRAHLLRLLFILPFLPAVAKAQSVHWDPPGGSLPVGETTTLQLVFEDCEPKDAPVLPKTDGLTLEYAGESSNMSWDNGSYSHSVTYNYTALLSNKQGAEIPSFEIETKKGRQQVAAVRYQPGTATVGSSGQPLESAASSKVEASAETVWAGQVFDLHYTIEAAHSYYPNFGHGSFAWKPDPLVAEDWSQPQPFDLSSGTEPQTGLAYRTRAIIRQPGSYHLNPISQLINLSVGVTGLGFFQQQQYQQFSVVSSTPTMEVRPLPGAPAGFTGAVGDFQLSSKVVPATAAVGEPITWTLELKGAGNWPDISSLPAREVSKDFQVVQPKAKRVSVPGKIFDATLTEDVVLIPTKPGSYALDPVRFVYFDPKEGGYKTLTAPGTTVVVTGSAGAGIQLPGAGVPAAAAGAAAPAIRIPESPPPPAGLPRDVLPDSGPATTPLAAGVLGSLLIAPFLLLLLFWLWLAWRRAQRTDPQRPRREARLRLEGTLARIRGAGRADRSALLLSWQQDAALLWEINHAAPSAGYLSQTGAWAELWSESERALYGPGTSLSDDWCARAAAALAAKPAPAFAARRIFLPRNLLPFLFALALAAGMLGAPSAAAADAAGTAAAAYRRADFAAAEAGWKHALSAEPANASARHNLSLALAQQNRWDEAAAQATAAFVQDPGNEAVRWQFALACDKAGYAPDALSAFLSPDLLQSEAQLASPAVWQLVLILAVWLGAAALGLLLALGFRTEGKKSRWPVIGALAALGLAAVLALAAGLGWSSYGMAADSDAVVIWRTGVLSSIPTEADASQKTEPLAAGSVARVDKSFLGWVRLAFANGQTGWVRKDETVGLWK